MARLLVLLGVIVAIVLAGVWIYQESRPTADRWVASPGLVRVVKFIGCIIFVLVVLAVLNLLFAFVELL